MDDKNKINRHCDNCMEHGIMALKVGEMCQWQRAHETGTNKWRSNMEKELAMLEKKKIIEHGEIRDEFKAVENRLSKWAIANLTGISLVLITLLLHLIFRDVVIRGVRCRA